MLFSVCYSVQILYLTKIGRVTALDTAAPLFQDDGIYPHKGDADWVEGVHTSAGSNIVKGQVGVGVPYGDVDFYPNGGQEQPGCSLTEVACNHQRAYGYYVSALQHPECKMTAGPICSNVEKANKGECDQQSESKTPFLGDLSRPPRSNSQTNSTIVYFKTSEEEPFCTASQWRSGVERL
ncbi:lipase member H-A-like [Tropilaelaps mercedesae]|uniref:Lipase member H-A-like n=1 Tax=Tropilaelaps mercedesae TaxID=418985 RepID=A0A1V9X272_9ACAR|nr:lipase member H-A-like [Tropilaelaps mercedesae]